MKGGWIGRKHKGYPLILTRLYSPTQRHRAIRWHIMIRRYGNTGLNMQDAAAELESRWENDRDIVLTYDLGHFHPTESVADKISATLLYMDRIMLHTSRGVRWDSDHVVIQNDELFQLMREVVRCNALNKVSIGLDFFDASINRIAAWVIGTRSTQKALLSALLEPLELLKIKEREWDVTARLGIMEECKNMPANAVWDYFCMTNNVPIGTEWIDEVKAYEREIAIRD